MSNSPALAKIEAEFSELFIELTELQGSIRTRLAAYADGKNLKGNELVGWLGEVYGKLLFDGTLVDDREEHDFVTSNGLRVSVKTRKGWNTGWRQSSAIPRIEGTACPTHLLFVHLNDDYSIDRMWLLEWPRLREAQRFRKHMVRGSQRSFIFAIDEQKDQNSVVYDENRRQAVSEDRLQRSPQARVADCSSQHQHQTEPVMNEFPRRGDEIRMLTRGGGSYSSTCAATRTPAHKA